MFFLAVLSVLATAVVGVGVAWACTTNADMTLANTTAPDQGKNYTTCVPPQYPTQCTRSVEVKGTNFTNSAGEPKVDSVDLYWIDEPFLAAGLGLQGLSERASAELCKRVGFKVASAVPVSGGSFSTTVNIPPAGRVAFYGSNAVCAVWTHTGAGHDSGLGNTYNIWPF